MEQKQPINNGKNLIVKNCSFCLIVFSLFEVNQSIGLDTRASYSSTTVNENRFYERNLTPTTPTTTNQPSRIPSSPLLQRRRIDEPITRGTISDNSLYFNARNVYRSSREFNNQP